MGTAGDKLTRPCHAFHQILSTPGIFPTAMADENEAKSEDKATVEISPSEKKVSDEMPPTYDEANLLTGGEEPSVKITSNETKIDIGKEKEAAQGLTKEELMKYANDPYWVRLRWILFILFWVIWVAMLAASIVIIIYAPKCPSPEPTRGERSGHRLHQLLLPDNWPGNTG